MKIHRFYKVSGPSERANVIKTILFELFQPVLLKKPVLPILPLFLQRFWWVCVPGVMSGWGAGGLVEGGRELGGWQRKAGVMGGGTGSWKAVEKEVKEVKQVF